MKIIQYLSFFLLSFFATVTLAANQYGICISNSTKMDIHIGLSLWNQTTLNISQKTITPSKTYLQVATAESNKEGNVNSTFYATLGDGPKTGYSTSLINVTDTKQSIGIRIQPNLLIINNKRYSVDSPDCSCTYCVSFTPKSTKLISQ